MSVLHSPHQSSALSGSGDSPTPAKRMTLESRLQTTSSPRALSVEDVALPRLALGGGCARYRLYDMTVKVYTAVQNRKLPKDVHFLDAATRRQVYQLVFDVIHRKTYYIYIYIYPIIKIYCLRMCTYE